MYQNSDTDSESEENIYFNMQIFSIFRFMFSISEKICNKIISFVIINCFPFSFFFEDKLYLQLFCGNVGVEDAN